MVVVKPLGVVTRQSTDIFAVQDDSVNEALVYIHRHIANNLQVGDVVEASGLSRRRLQEKFYTTLGRSIHDEIKRIRIEQLEKALLETNLSVQQIARKFGFKENHHISRFFKTQKGMSPTEFRERYAVRR